MALVGINQRQGMQQCIFGRCVVSGKVSRTDNRMSPATLSNLKNLRIV